MKRTVLAMALAAIGCTPAVRAGYFACDTDEDCKGSGYLCIAGRCGPRATTDAQVQACSSDAQCGDAIACTIDRCQSGACVHVPDTTCAVDGGSNDAGPPDSGAIVHPFPSDGSEGPFEPTTDTVLTPGVHNFTTITIPAGVTVTTMGTGILELRATGPIQIDGVLDVSGADAIDSGGGYTGDPNSRGGAGEGGAGGSATVLLAGQDSEGPGGGGGQWGGGGGGHNHNGAGGGGGGPGGGGGGTSRNSEGTCSGTAAQPGGAGGGGAAGGTPTTPAGGGSSQSIPEYDGRDGQLGAVITYNNSCGTTTTVTGSGGGGGGGIGRISAADLAVNGPTLVPGSGGGGGGSGGSVTTFTTAPGGAGGGGGGAIRLASPISISINGAVRADGGNGGNGVPAVSTGPSAGGGGGSGGVVYLAAPSLVIASMATVTASGGLGGAGMGAPAGHAASGDGGHGGVGRIRLSVSEASCSIAGTVDPPAWAGCAPASMPGFVYVGAYPQ